jgi:serine/threonine-protein kinase
MVRTEYEHNLLFGVLALQNGLIDQAKLVAAFQAWTLAPERPLAEHLVERGDLDADDRSAVEGLVARHLKKHGGNTEDSLAAIPAGRLICEDLAQVPDSKIEDILVRLHHGSSSTDRDVGDPKSPVAHETLEPSRAEPGPETFAGGASILPRIDAQVGPVARLLLHDTDPHGDPFLASDSATHGSAGRYQLIGEIARGGMGVVFKARDPDLGRALAVKVLSDHHRHRPDLVHRFVEEAQICGQLQHPGVVPVYELGVLADRRPFFTMKLVKGQTLARLLAGRCVTHRADLPHPGPPPQPGEGANNFSPPRPSGERSPQDVGGEGPLAEDTGGGIEVASDLPRFLAIFQAICQTVAYAHARGVIHRDLKPSNVMVGSFGEVQVMDWGLAKVLPRPGDAEQPSRTEVQHTVVATARSRGDSKLSQAGTVLGTPAYMCPEQARGETTTVDRRADVFALGSILSEILTGEPAFTGCSPTEVLEAASRGDTSGAVARLAHCSADPDLIALACDCLNARANDRPADAAVVAIRMTAYLAGVQDRLRCAELAQAAESARALEARRTAEAALAKVAAEQKSRRLTAALAATIVLSCGLGAAGWRWVELERINRTRAAASRINTALQDATRLHGRAHGAKVGELSPWADARAAAEKARDLLIPDIEPGLRRQVEALVAEVAAERSRAEAAATAAERDRRLLDRLIDIRSAEADDRGGLITDLTYGDAFREAGLDVLALPPDQAATAIRSRTTQPLPIVAAALDDWAAVRRDRKKDRAGAAALTAIAQATDPDPWRNRLRAALDLPDQIARRSVLENLAKAVPTESLGPVSLDLLGRALKDTGDPAGAEAVLRRAQERYPTDLWINYDLASALEKLARREEAIRFYTAARSIRPDSAHELAHALDDNGESDKAIVVFRDLVRLRPTNGRYLGCLGQILKASGHTQEAQRALATAEAVLRSAIRDRPDDAFAHCYLGFALTEQDKLEEAAAEYRATIRLQPDYALAHNNLGWSLDQGGKLDEAIAEFRIAIRLQPDYALAHNNLGWAFDQRGDLPQAIAEYREAIRVKPDYALPHNNLGWALSRQKKSEAATAEYREAIRLKPDFAKPYNNIGTELMELGKYDEAIAHLRTAIRLGPDNALPHNNLAWALITHPNPGRRRPIEAVEHARKAIALDPKEGTYYNTLALAEYRAGHWALARAACEQSMKLQDAAVYDDFVLAMTLWQLGDQKQSRTLFDKAVAWTQANDPRNPELIQLWREAAELLGQVGPSTSTARVTDLPANPFAPRPMIRSGK